jgi:carbon-monoxide dehydrogenase medium subunit/xanthine dehydrogenase FAD-binding subunit
MELKEVYKAKSIDEALFLLEKYKGEGKLIAGGTDTIIDMRNEEIFFNVLIDISSIEELSYIQEKEDFIEIGSMTTFTQIVESEIPARNLNGFKKACRLIGSPQIRNRGTIGGNIANGSAAADSVPPLLALDSILTILSSKEKREIRLEDFLMQPNSERLKEDELLHSIKFRKLSDNQVLTFAKLCLRKALAISRISMSILLELNDNREVKDIKIASGSLGKYPMREREVESFLKGRNIDEEAVDEAYNILKKVLRDRLMGRPTLEYKEMAVKGLLIEAINDGLDYFQYQEVIA